MGVRKSGYVRNEQGERVLGQGMTPSLDHPATAWSDQRYRDYEQRVRRDSFPGFDNPSPAVVRGRQDADVAAWRRTYPERLRDAGDLERAAAIPVPDDNMMNLRRRMTG